MEPITIGWRTYQNLVASIEPRYATRGIVHVAYTPERQLSLVAEPKEVITHLFVFVFINKKWELKSPNPTDLRIIGQEVPKHLKSRIPIDVIEDIENGELPYSYIERFYQ